MQILIYIPVGSMASWVSGFQAILPDADIVEWQPGLVSDAKYAVVWSPPQQLLDEQPQLTTLFNIGAGIDAIAALTIPETVEVVRLDDAGMSVQMAEYVCQAVIRHFRELDAYDKAMSQGEWDFRKPRMRHEFPVGIMGLGVLGSRVAKALQVFEYDVHGWSRTPKQLDGVQTYHGHEGFKSFLSQSKILVNLLPLTEQTTGILNLETFNSLPEQAYVINVARGGHLVEQDLLTALDSGSMSGATLDVFQQEPLPLEHPFWHHPKITLTPHTAARTFRHEAIAQISGKIMALESGQFIAGVVDPKKGY